MQNTTPVQACNPFATLLQSGSNVPNKVDDSAQTTGSLTAAQRLEINDLLENVFEITTYRENLTSDFASTLGFIYIGELNETNDIEFLSVDNLEEVLLQRIMINDKSSLEERVCHKDAKPPRPPKVNQFIYLYECFKRLNVNENKKKSIELNVHEHCQNLIINMCRSLLNIYEDQLEELSQKFLLLIKLYYGQDAEEEKLLQSFYHSFINQFEESEKFKKQFIDSDTNVCEINQIIDDKAELDFLNNLFVILNKSVIALGPCEDFSNDYVYYLKLVKFLTPSKLMKYLLISNAFLPNADGATFQRARLWQTTTIIGKLLTPSPLPLSPFKQPANPLMLAEPTPQYKYFQNPGRLTKQDVEINEKNMHQLHVMIKRELRSFFYEHLIKLNSSLKIRHLLLKWVGRVLDENKAKMQEWSNLMQAPQLMGDRYVSDGFLINLLDIFLDYSMPFCASHWSNSNKLLKISPKYSSMSDANFLGLQKETKLIPTTQSDSDQNSTNQQLKVSSANFISECYYGTNALIRAAYLSLNQKIIKLNQELARWQQTYQDLMTNSGGGNNLDPQMNRIKVMFETMSIEFMNLKSILIEEDLVKKISKFLFNSSAWLCYMALGAEPEDFDLNSNTTFIKKLDNLKLLKEPSKQYNLNILAQLPEFLVTNIVEFMIFLNRFKESSLNDVFLDGQLFTDGCQIPDYLNSFLSLVLTFMGRPDRIFNPHIRASLAEAVECLLPKKQQSFSASARRNLSYLAFARHPCSSYVSEALLNVFVSIEMTGQSVQFEQKFNYRRPMYELIEYLWNMPEIVDPRLSMVDGSFSPSTGGRDDDFASVNQHRIKLKELADQAFVNINNSEQPPLFLKFLNYLINDANFLLLEGLLYLEKIKISQDKLEQDNANRTLTQAQRSEMQSSLKHMIMLAKFHNFMSTKTIQTLRMLTSEVKSIFCHDVLVDRLATMLNDFLLHLVGKKKRKQLKVKNFDEVEFKPKEVVSTICDIYLNLGTERSFCEAVCRDGRSYSSDLFASAIEVLEQINRDVDMVQRFAKFAAHIEKIAEQQREDESSFDDAPDEFLDPIMSCLMSDPVILPSSKQIVDRSTISRHLLSDQNDPFNRSPLTIQEVIPATELKEKIEIWKASKRTK